MIKFDASTFYDPNKKNTIYTLDIETTSLFKNPDTGEWEVFDYTRPPEYYKGTEKAGVPYIYMFGVNETVYYGTDFSEIETILKLIATDKEKILFIFNSAFEFQFMRDILENYTIENMIARAVRKPIAYTIKELNIQVRCAYMLTGLSLEKASERYTNIRKKVNDLDYNKARSPRTVEFMTTTELSYCEYDILCLYAIIRHFESEYGSLRKIPYTQTGEVRRAYKKRVDFHYLCTIAKKTPDDRMYLILQKAFQGGMTHANCLYVNRLLTCGVGSYDISSSYPTTFMFKFPVGKLRPVTPDRADKLDREKWAVLYHVIFHKIRARKLNKYILNTKIATGSGIYSDNGRLVKADRVEMFLTEVDYDIITKDAYEIERIEVKEAWCAPKDYLPRELVTFALELYNDKTTLKGVKGKEEFYMKQKQMLNSIFGCACYNILKSGCKFINNDWKRPELTIPYVHEKLEELRNKRSNAFLYTWGVWITAYARERLWRVISQLDNLVVYYDTDSIKYIDDPKVHAVIKTENDMIKKKLETACDDMDIDVEMLRPKDKSGIEHPLGLWEDEVKSYAIEFKTLGAKRYAYRTKDNQLHCTVSGVNNKTGYKALKDDINNFNKSLVFDYESAKKLTSYYNDNQPDIIFKDYLGQVYKSTQRHGICLQPTVYSMSMTQAFEAYIEETQNGFKKGEWIK